MGLGLRFDNISSSLMRRIDFVALFRNEARVVYATVSNRYVERYRPYVEIIRVPHPFLKRLTPNAKNVRQ